MTKEEFRKLKKGDIVVCNFLGGKKGVVCSDRVQFDQQAIFVRFNVQYLTLLTISNCKAWSKVYDHNG